MDDPTFLIFLFVYVVSYGHWTTDDRICTSKCYVCIYICSISNTLYYVHQESGHNRPMTSVKGAGYTSSGRSGLHVVMTLFNK